MNFRKDQGAEILKKFKERNELQSSKITKETSNIRNDDQY